MRSEQKYVQRTDDTTGSPVGWMIVAIGRDGSILCQSPSGKRRRYQIECHLTDNARTDDTPDAVVMRALVQEVCMSKDNVKDAREIAREIDALRDGIAREAADRIIRDVNNTYYSTRPNELRQSIFSIVKAASNLMNGEA